MTIRNRMMVFVSYLLLGIGFTSGQTCYKTGNFTTNSNYARNRDLFLSSLASNLTAIQGGYYTATIGQDPDKVYGLVLCRGDSSSESCASCVNYTIHDMMTNCPNQKEAISWGGMDFPCVVRYSNRSIFGKLELTPKESNYNVHNIKTNLMQFDQIWGNLMDRVLVKAYAGNSKRKFATAEKNLTRSRTVYALMQCTPDISKRDCEFCLRQSMGYLQSCCYGKQGGYVLGPSCIFRWELYPFYGSAADSLPPSPQSSPSVPKVSTNTTITKDKGGIALGTVIIIVVSTNIFTMALVAFTCDFLRRRRMQKRKDAEEIYTVECLQFDFSTIRDATDNFSLKIGEGGFGCVYKGMLSNGQDIAVKRLRSSSLQGEWEFKNEVHLMARLQHRNLVRLLGFCFEGTKRLLVYEYVPNPSLDKFIFGDEDHMNRLLDWETRYKIIGGIARGIRYLHEDSRLQIIHCDIKASNILLDADMNPRIADFALAKLIEMDSGCSVSRIAGTCGYMAPEYAIHGHMHVKLDVYSFGVLVLEIVSGRSNSRFDGADNLLTLVWDNWNEGSALSLIDPTLRTIDSSREIMRCIHIGLLCVQDNVEDRPTIGSVVLMLNSISISLPLPKKPVYSTLLEQDDSESENNFGSGGSISERLITSINDND